MMRAAAARRRVLLVVVNCIYIPSLCVIVIYRPCAINEMGLGQRIRQGYILPLHLTICLFLYHICIRIDCVVCVDRDIDIVAILLLILNINVFD